MLSNVAVIAELSGATAAYTLLLRRQRVATSSTMYNCVNSLFMAFPLGQKT